MRPQGFPPKANAGETEEVRLSANISVPAAPSKAVTAKRLLLIKFGSIGDVIMAIPGAALMHAEGFTVDWVASDAVAPVLGLYPWINVIAVDEGQLLRGSVPVRLRHLLRFWRLLRQQTRRHGPYDLVATLYYDPRYRLLSFFVPALRRLRLSHDDRRSALLPGRHHTDEYARILSGRPDGETPSQLAPVPVPSLPLATLPAERERPRIVLVPGGARNVLRDDALRRWPVASYVALAQMLLQHGCQVVLAGGPDDRWVTPHFEPGADGGAPRALQSASLLNQIGTCSLLDTLGLLGSAAVTVTHDTGPLHLAGITSTSIVALFGPTDPHGRLPRRGNTVAIWGGEGFACRPCYDGRDYAPCQHNGCIRQITPALVFEHILRLLAARSRGEDLLPCIVVPEPAAPVLVVP